MEKKKGVSERAEKIIEHIMISIVACVAVVLILGLGKFALWIISL